MDAILVYLQFPYVRYALIVGVLIALCSSLLGVTLVLRRFSFIGDGLSHVAFGAMAMAGVLRLGNSSMLFVLPVTVLCAILLLRGGQNARVKGDAAIAMISVGALAVGYLLLNLFSASGNLSGDVCTTMFGSMSILTLRRVEVWLSLGLSVAVIALFRYISVGSMLLVIAFFILSFFFSGGNACIIIWAAVLMVMCVARHHANIGRLIHGTENKLGKKAR